MSNLEGLRELTGATESLRCLVKTAVLGSLALDVLS